MTSFVARRQLRIVVKCRPLSLALRAMTSTQPCRSGVAQGRESTHQVSRRVRLTQSPTVVMTRKYMEGSQNVLSLGQGIVHWQPPAEALERALTAARDDPAVSSYGPDEGMPELRARLREKIVKENGLEGYDVMVTAGAQQAFINCLLTLCDQGDGIVLFKPFYFNHAMNVEMTGSGAHLIEGPCNPETLQPDLDWLEWRCRQPDPPKMVVCVNPCNPTGVVMSKGELERVAEICGACGAWLLMDNAYEYFLYDGRQHHCVAAPHVVHLFSFSKSHGMMGWRIGYIAYPAGSGDASLADNMVKVQDSVVVCASQIGQRLALECLSLDPQWVQNLVQSLETNREAVRKALAPLGSMGHGIHGGEGAFYFWAKLPATMAGHDDAVIKWLVHRHGVCVIPGASCGTPGFIRVAFANLPNDQCKHACERLHRGLSELVAMEDSSALLNS